MIIAAIDEALASEEENVEIINLFHTFFSTLIHLGEWNAAIVKWNEELLEYDLWKTVEKIAELNLIISYHEAIVTQTDATKTHITIREASCGTKSLPRDRWLYRMEINLEGFTRVFPKEKIQTLLIQFKESVLMFRREGTIISMPMNIVYEDQ